MPTARVTPFLAGALLLAVGCTSRGDQSAAATPPDSPAAVAAPGAPAASTSGQSGVRDDESQKDVVKVAAGSKDHTTLVAALEAADLVNSLSNAGPFTVFAPTNAAFDKLPKGTVEDLLKPQNKAKLADVLQHHVTVPALDSSMFTDGLELAMADGGKAKIVRKDGATFVGGAKIVGAVRASNGWVYVVDGVILPESKK